MKVFSIIVFSAVFYLLIGCEPSSKDKGVAPGEFTVLFKTTKGDFKAKFIKEWSPLGVQRVYDLLKSDFYNDMAFYRVIDNYVAQFGISDNDSLNSYWEKNPIKDEKVIEPNILGNISFARSGPNTRSHQLYISLKNNSPRLDTLHWNNVTGFPAIGKIIEGLENALKLNPEYGEEISKKNDSVKKYGNSYLRKSFPNVDFIKTATIVK